MNPDPFYLTRLLDKAQVKQRNNGTFYACETPVAHRAWGDGTTAADALSALRTAILANFAVVLAVYRVITGNQP